MKSQQVFIVWLSISQPGINPLGTMTFWILLNLASYVHTTNTAPHRGFPWNDLILPVLADQGIYVSMNHQNQHSERRLNDAQKDAASG